MTNDRKVRIEMWQAQIAVSDLLNAQSIRSLERTWDADDRQEVLNYADDKLEACIQALDRLLALDLDPHIRDVAKQLRSEADFLRCTLGEDLIRNRGFATAEDTLCEVWQAFVKVLQAL